MRVERENMTVNVLYQFNEAYVVFAGVSMTSLYENNRDVEELNTYILAENVSEKSKNELIENARKYGRELVFFETEKLVDYMKKVGIPPYRNSYATNMKMFIPQFLSKDIERLLYIDSDTIIKGSIKLFYEMNMYGKPIAMGLDSLGDKHKIYIGLNETDDYYNAGIILYDMKQWREQQCTEKIVYHVKNVRAHYMSPDQDLLNIVFRKNICRFDLRYNLQPHHMIYSPKQMNCFFKQKNYYTDEEVRKAADSPVIIHSFRFLGEFPWHFNNVHPAKEMFDRYIGLSQWKEYERKVTEQNSIVFKVERILYRILPKTIFLFLFKMSYERFIYNASRASEKQENVSEM